MLRIYIGQDDLRGTERDNAYVYTLPRIAPKKFGSPYLNMSDVEHMYYHLNGYSREGFQAFRKKAQEISERTENHRYMFKDEAKLFELLKERFASEFENKQITDFGHLMQLFA